MPINKQHFTPFIPSDAALNQTELPNKAVSLMTQSARLALLPLETRQTIIRHMAIINSYYSNLIEGNRIEPCEIREAQRGDFSTDAAKRDLQLESLAHIYVQQWLEQRLAKNNYDINELFSIECVQSIHKEFYQHVPESLRTIKNDKDEVVGEIIPGQWRNRDVKVGKHIAAPAEDLPALMPAFIEAYHPNNYRGDKKVIAVLCAHHRFAWIHPFTDGNGRVARLFTDAALKVIGIESAGIWCLSRGLARSAVRYKQSLELADYPRQGDLDGRGSLSEKNLLAFCDFMLDTALDQVDYISKLLNLESMHQRIKSYIQARNDGRVEGMGKIKDIAALILYNAFVAGSLERATAIELTGMPERSALRLIAQLKQEGLLADTSSRSPLYWQIPEHAESWYFPQLAPMV